MLLSFVMCIIMNYGHLQYVILKSYVCLVKMMVCLMSSAEKLIYEEANCCICEW